MEGNWKEWYENGNIKLDSNYKDDENMEFLLYSIDGTETLEILAGTSPAQPIVRKNCVSLSNEVLHKGREKLMSTDE